MNRLRLLAPLLAAASLMLAAPVARGAVLSVLQAAVSLTDSGAPNVFGFAFSKSINISGNPVSQTHFGAALMDASDNGASLTGLFDCGIAGCPFMTLELFFSCSGGGDVYGFVVRNEISTPDNAVPEPAALAFLALGLTGLGISRRRR